LIIIWAIIKPKQVEYQRVTNRTNNTAEARRPKSLSVYLINNPSILASVIPKPPGMNESIPDIKLVKKIWVEVTKPILTPIAWKARKTETAIRISAGVAKINPSKTAFFEDKIFSVSFEFSIRSSHFINLGNLTASLLKKAKNAGFFIMPKDIKARAIPTTIINIDSKIGWMAVQTIKINKTEVNSLHFSMNTIGEVLEMA